MLKDLDITPDDPADLRAVNRLLADAPIDTTAAHSWWTNLVQIESVLDVQNQSFLRGFGRSLYKRGDIGLTTLRRGRCELGRYTRKLGAIQGPETRLHPTH